MFFNKTKTKYEDSDFSQRFVIDISKDGNYYFVLVWDMWLKAKKDCYGRRRLFCFKDDISEKEIETKINEYINEVKDELRKEFEEEYNRKKTKK